MGHAIGSMATVSPLITLATQVDGRLVGDCGSSSPRSLGFDAGVRPGGSYKAMGLLWPPSPCTCSLLALDKAAAHHIEHARYIVPVLAWIAWLVVASVESHQRPVSCSRRATGARLQVSLPQRLRPSPVRAMMRILVTSVRALAARPKGGGIASPTVGGHSGDDGRLHGDCLRGHCRHEAARSR
jgi:hypothetical protein